DRAQSQDGCLWLINDRSAHHIAKRPYIGNRKGSFANLIRLQIILPGAAGKVIYRLGKPHQTHLIGMTDDWDDQVPRWTPGGHPDVDLFPLDDLGPAYGNIQDR